MKTIIRLISILMISLAIIISCGKGEKMEHKKVNYTSIKDIPETAWKKLSEKKIFFGHQSVGFNIIDGIRDVMKECPQIKLNIIETHDPKQFDSPIFGHSRVGKNTDPNSKCDAFAEYLKSGIGNKVDIPFLKFCYVDVRANTNPQEVLDYYTKTIESLKKEYPKVTFVHFTVPLTVTKTSIKTWIKKIIGKKDIWEYDDNIKRNEYNELLKKHYKDKEPVFDLAGIESTFADGKRCTFSKDGKTYYSLVPEYTTDGGHLNEKGRKIVAEKLLVFLANLAQ